MKAAKDGIGAIGGSIGGGIANKLFVTSDIKDYLTKVSPRVSSYSLGLVKLDPNDAEQYTKDLQKSAKGIIGNGFDFLSSQIDIPGAPPAPPAPPVASFTEASYSGTITSSNDINTLPLLVPGAVPKGYVNSNGVPTNGGINKHNYPAYNEVLGLFALLKTPKVEVKAKELNPVLTFKKGILKNYTPPSGSIPNNYYFDYTSDEKTFLANYQIRLVEPLVYRFNHVVDFNFEKTKLYYSYRIKLKNKSYKLSSYGQLVNNFFQNYPESNNPPYDFKNQSIVEKESYSFESYSDFTTNKGNYVIVTTPFTEVNNILNEPISITNSIVLNSLNINNILMIISSPFPPNNNLNDTIKYNSFLNSIDLTLTDYSNIQSIEIKLMADMYFLSPGSKGQELNTLQTFTYKIYENSGNDNQMPSETNSTIGNVTFLKNNESLLKHQPGNVVLDNIQISPATITAYTHHLVNATEMHIYVENAILKNNITVAPGYTAYIHFLGSALSNPESIWQPELVLDNIKSEDLYNNPLIYEATDDEVMDFCGQSNKYKANTSLSKTSNDPIVKPIKVIEKPSIQFNIYPNPANDIATVLFQLNGAIGESINIYNLAGTLVKSVNITGNNQETINTHDLASGVYLVTLNASNSYSETNKLIIAK
ncbi:MAG: T9SS type A sorting domain-containing protein [Bacteroidota bacterium]